MFLDFSFFPQNDHSLSPDYKKDISAMVKNKIFHHTDKCKDKAKENRAAPP